MVIVDASVWIDYLTGAPNAEAAWLEYELPRQEIGLTDLTVCEVLQGIRDDAMFQQLRSRLTAMSVLSSGGVEIAVAAAENYRILRTKGITVRKTIDCLIATFCIREGHELLHRDRDFDPFEMHLGLQVIHP
ncbi:MAG TPA: PIN domain nuclease [Acidobacteriaceae bacterium]